MRVPPLLYSCAVCCTAPIVRRTPHVQGTCGHVGIGDGDGKVRLQARTVGRRHICEPIEHACHVGVGATNCCADVAIANERPATTYNVATRTYKYTQHEAHTVRSFRATLLPRKAVKGLCDTHMYLTPTSVGAYIMSAAAIRGTQSGGTVAARATAWSHSSHTSSIKMNRESISSTQVQPRAWISESARIHVNFTTDSAAVGFIRSSHSCAARRSAPVATQSSVRALCTGIRVALLLLRPLYRTTCAVCQRCGSQNHTTGGKGRW